MKIKNLFICLFVSINCIAQISKPIIDTTKNKAYRINYTKSTGVIEFNNTLYLNSLDTQIKCLVFFPNKKYKKVRLTCKLLKEIKNEKLKKFSIKPDKIFKYSDLYIIDDKPNLVVADSLENNNNFPTFKPKESIIWESNLSVFSDVDSLFQDKLNLNISKNNSLNFYYCKMKVLFIYELDYFDHDRYPINRLVSSNEIANRLNVYFSKDSSQKKAILNCIGKNENDILSVNELQFIYNLYKKLNAFSFTINENIYEYKITSYAKDNSLNFNPIYFNHNLESKKSNKYYEYFFTISGKMEHNGKVVETKKEHRERPYYPICLSANSIILTPSGYVNILNLKINDDVISLNKYGKKEIAKIIKIDSTKINFEHYVVQLILENGNKIEVSPIHPLKDGRKMSDIKAGNYINDIKVISANLVKYEYPYTYDILLSNSTSLYNVNGIWLKSTLKK